MANFDVKILTGPPPRNDNATENLMQHYATALKSRLHNQNGTQIGALAQAIMKSQSQKMMVMS
jgi:hypothetical protein